MCCAWLIVVFRHARVCACARASMCLAGMPLFVLKNTRVEKHGRPLTRDAGYGPPPLPVAVHLSGCPRDLRKLRWWKLGCDFDLDPFLRFRFSPTGCVVASSSDSAFVAALSLPLPLSPPCMSRACALPVFSTSIDAAPPPPSEAPPEALLPPLLLPPLTSIWAILTHLVTLSEAHAAPWAPSTTTTAVTSRRRCIRHRSVLLRCANDIRGLLKGIRQWCIYCRRTCHY